MTQYSAPKVVALLDLNCAVMICDPTVSIKAHAGGLDTAKTVDPGEYTLTVGTPLAEVIA